ncbi:uncharacterized protein LOC120705175 [Panicum virgatum]|uniref:uncharacterized protein LOC120705175 n=1 Tax=Panicum virgatum TaxID=38727 RepID=UPI0019D5C018|nr:uncharacterized protein LOC120705175 [Panicum virgatum]
MTENRVRWRPPPACPSPTPRAGRGKGHYRCATCPRGRLHPRSSESSQIRHGSPSYTRPTLPPTVAGSGRGPRGRGQAGLGQPGKGAPRSAQQRTASLPQRHCAPAHASRPRQAKCEPINQGLNTIKNKLRSKMGQKFLNNYLTTFIEREFFLQAKDEDIIKY